MTHPSYMMRRITVIAPRLRNDGESSGYPVNMRSALIGGGYTGWTEHPTLGYWRGTPEAGVMFEVLVLDRDAIEHAHRIAGIARRVMPDQEAIQVVIDHSNVVVIEG